MHIKCLEYDRSFVTLVGGYTYGLYMGKLSR